MELAEFVVPPEEAAAKVAEYTALIDAERTAEDRAILAGYRAAARGLPLISLPRTITAGGWHPDSLPKIGIAPADATECFVRWDNGDLVFADREGWSVNRGALVGAHSLRVSVPGDDRPLRIPGMARWSGRAPVPLIPPKVRPRLRRLRHMHILWEVPAWKPVAPVDPALLRHIRGDLWAVLATWDLTPLEREVLSQR